MSLQNSSKEKQIGTKSPNLCQSESIQREKQTNSLSNASKLQKSRENPPELLLLTNKESVFGLCLDELLSYYKAIPLELDFGFLRNIRRVYARNSEFEKEQNLRRAAEILAESKNKGVKEQMEQYREEYEAKFGRAKPAKHPGLSRSISQSPPKKQALASKPPPLFLERIKVKSEHSEEEQTEIFENQNEGRKSLLICPTNAKEISFDSSNRIFKKVAKESSKNSFELPELVQSKFVACHAKSTLARNKPLRVLGYKNRPTQESWSGIPPKEYDFKKPQSIEKILRKHISNSSTTNESRLQNPEKMSRNDGEEFRRNRRLMLELLKSKNRNAFFGV